MIRTVRQHADAQILERAAGLFARRGFARTSVQEIADAVGLSKAGLLHHFPSKDALHAAVLARAEILGRQVVDGVQDLPLGVDRDRRVVDGLVDVALAHPGMVTLLLAPVLQDESDATAPDVGGAGAAAFEAFGVDPRTADPERAVRVIGALAALAVLSLAANHQDQTTAWRSHITATCFDALGHRRPGATSSRSHQVEA